VKNLVAILGKIINGYQAYDIMHACVFYLMIQFSYKMCIMHQLHHAPVNLQKCAFCLWPITGLPLLSENVMNIHVTIFITVITPSTFHFLLSILGTNFFGSEKSIRHALTVICAGEVQLLLLRINNLI